ncbi:MAG: SDR family oxidoreductase [Gemmatimonadaceae bacterium]|nr:SDR family oxidoreductase [Gemmatimonadaceae bacterium]
MSHPIAGTVALVTGANRGIGAALVTALLARGAAKVYATARRPETLEALIAGHGDRVVPLTLDVTDPAQVAALAASAPDVRLLVNNAGVAAIAFQPATDPAQLPALRAELETNVIGLHAVTLAMVPVLARSPGATIVNLGSVASFVSFGPLPTYSASKAAVHSLTQGMRAALRPQGIAVLGVYPGPVETDMGKVLPVEKTAPSVVANAILDGIEAGTEEILPDPLAQQLGAAYFADPKGLERAQAA